MKATCPQCGEELLGAVNRCWRCETEFVSDPDDSRAPPERQAPASEREATDETAVDEPEQREPAELAEMIAPCDDLAPTAEIGESAANENEVVESAEVITDGEPPVIVPHVASAAGRSPGGVGTEPPYVSQAKGTSRLFILFGAVAILIGLVSCGFSLDSLWALPLAAFGVALGACGLMGRHRGPALVGILICCVALTLSGYRALVAVYTWYTGYGPSDRRPAEDVLFDEPEEDDGWDDEEDW